MRYSHLNLIFKSYVLKEGLYSLNAINYRNSKFKDEYARNYPQRNYGI